MKTILTKNKNRGIFSTACMLTVASVDSEKNTSFKVATLFFNPKYQHFSQQKTTQKYIRCNPVTPKTQKMLYSQNTINQSITNIQVQQLLTFAATKVHFAATATHFLAFFSLQKSPKPLTINV
jgi:hypothetical protein